MCCYRLLLLLIIVIILFLFSFTLAHLLARLLARSLFHILARIKNGFQSYRCFSLSPTVRPIFDILRYIWMNVCYIFPCNVKMRYLYSRVVYGILFDVGSMLTVFCVRAICLRVCVCVCVQYTVYMRNFFFSFFPCALRKCADERDGERAFMAHYVERVFSSAFHST